MRGEHRKPCATGSIDVPQPGSDEAFVYRMYCRCGDLLYVGLAQDLFTRLGGHYGSRGTEWIGKVVRIEWDTYRDYSTARTAEQYQIRRLGPLHNRQGNGAHHPRWKPLPWPRRLTSREQSERLRDARDRLTLPGDRL